MIARWLKASIFAAIAIVAALQLHIVTGNVFSFASDTVTFAVWFVVVEALALLASVAYERRRGGSQAQIDASLLGVGIAVGPLFKYLVAPFLYEPFRSLRVYVYFFGVYGALSLLSSLGARRRLVLRPYVGVLLAASATLALVANPSGFQGAYPQWIRAAKNAVWVGADTLPMAMAPVFNQTFDQPIAVRRDPGDPTGLVVAERGGRIKALTTGALPEAPATVLLDLSVEVGELGEERGLSNVVFHPRFAGGEPYIYVMYTAKKGAGSSNRLSRFETAREAGALRILRASESVLIDQDDRDQLHNGGGMAFGPDGFLYVGVGDEGGYNDPFGNAQRLDGGLFSGILRLDVDRRGEPVSRPPARQPAQGRTEGYFVPNDNPFVDVPGALGEFWAIGLRNPFRLAFDAQGRLWTADVGQNNFEEIDLVEKGDNLGWSYREGPAPNNDSRFKGTAPAPLQGRAKEPVYFYRHSGATVCVIGGFVYEGAARPSLVGRYLYADLAGEVYALSYEGGAVSGVELIAIAPTPGLGIAGLFPVDDEVYLTLLGGADGGATGRIMRLVPRGTAGALAVDVNRKVSIEEKYATFCSRCHGVNGRPVAATGGTTPRDFSDAAWSKGADDERLMRVIQEGGAAVGLSAEMPPWKGVLTDEETSAMIVRIRRFAAP